MAVLEAVILAIALGADALSVAVAIGVGRPGARQRWAVVFLFSVVQSLFFLGGHFLFHAVSWGIGRWQSGAGGVALERLGGLAGSPGSAGWLTVVGSGLLIILGLRMLATSSPLPARPTRRLATRLMELLVLAASVSTDAAVAGFGLGFLEGRASVTVAAWITLVVAPMVGAGLFVGRWLERWVGAWASVFGGCVLVLLGLHLFWTGWPQ